MIRPPPSSPLFPTPPPFRYRRDRVARRNRGGHGPLPPLRDPAEETHARGDARRDHRAEFLRPDHVADRKSTRLNSSHLVISYAVFCLEKNQHGQPPGYRLVL